MLKKSYLFIHSNLEKLANIRIPYLHCLKNNLNIRLRACHALEQIQRHMSGFCTKKRTFTLHQLQSRHAEIQNVWGLFAQKLF